MLAEGEGAKITPGAIREVIDPIRDDVHQVQPHAISITQASEYGRAYRPEEISAIAELARSRGLGLHMDGARFANAAAFLGVPAAEAAGPVVTRGRRRIVFLSARKRERLALGWMGKYLGEPASVKGHANSPRATGLGS